MELTLNVLGGFELTVAGDSVAGQLHQRSRELTAFLFTYPNLKHSREKLASMFWPDSDERSCQRSLSTVLWRTREAIKHVNPATPPIFVATPQGEIFVNHAVEYFCDAFEVKTIGKTIRDKNINDMSSDNINKLIQCRNIYLGPYMDGSHLDWILWERERIESDYIDLMIRLLFYYKSTGAYDGAISVAREILDADELRELVHRELIDLYALTGQRPQAILQYKKCTSILEHQLGIRPMVETTRVLERILSS